MAGLGRVGIWTPQLDAWPAGQACDAAAELEALGYGAIWLPDGFGREPFVNATLLLGATQRIVVATGVATIHARDARAMSSARSTLSEAFPGRFVLGLGVSHRQLVEQHRGGRYARPVATMRAYLSAMDAVSQPAAAPPAQLAPRVLAALGPRMLELAASLADGAHPFLAPVEHTAFAREILGDRPVLAPEQTVILESDASSARALARAWLSQFFGLENYVDNWKRFGLTEDDLAGGGSDRLVDRLVAWGGPERIAERVAEQFAAGADHVALQVVVPGDLTPGPAVPMEQWRQLAPALAEHLTQPAHGGRAASPIG